MAVNNKDQGRAVSFFKQRIIAFDSFSEDASSNVEALKLFVGTMWLTFVIRDCSLERFNR